MTFSFPLLSQVWDKPSTPQMANLAKLCFKKLHKVNVLLSWKSLLPKTSQGGTTLRNEITTRIRTSKLVLSCHCNQTYTMNKYFLISKTNRAGLDRPCIKNMKPAGLNSSAVLARNIWSWLPTLWREKFWIDLRPSDSNDARSKDAAPAFGSLWCLPQRNGFHLYVTFTDSNLPVSTTKPYTVQSCRLPCLSLKSEVIFQCFQISSTSSFSIVERSKNNTGLQSSSKNSENTWVWGYSPSENCDKICWQFCSFFKTFRFQQKCFHSHWISRYVP